LNRPKRRGFVRQHKRPAAAGGDAQIYRILGCNHTNDCV
jgi:hypothetical protein